MKDQKQEKNDQIVNVKQDNKAQYDQIQQKQNQKYIERFEEQQKLLREKVAQTEELLKQKENHINDCKEQLHELLNETNQKEKEIQLLKSNLDQSQKEISQQKVQIQQLHNEGKRKENENQTLQSKLDNQKEEIKNLETKQTELQGLYEKAMKKNKELENQINKSHQNKNVIDQRQISQLTQQIEILKKESQILQSSQEEKINRLELDLKQGDKEKNILLIQNQALKQEQINLQGLRQENEKIIRQMEVKIMQMNQELQKYQSNKQTNQPNTSQSNLAQQNRSQDDQQDISANKHRTPGNPQQFIQDQQRNQASNTPEQNLSQQNKIQEYQENISKSQYATPGNPQQFVQNRKIKQVYPRKSLTSYQNEYKYSENIKKVIIELKLKFDSYRSIQNDGNCYYRAFGFSFLEHLCRYSTPVQYLEEFINKLESDKGYYQIRPNNRNNNHQILKQAFLRLLNNLKDQKVQNKKFLQLYLEQEIENNKDRQDEALVWQMRCLTANYLESHREYFESFCQISYKELIMNVLTMGKEADGLAVGPLQVVLKVKIDIITIDRNYAEALQFDQMKIAGKFPLIYILYKPGHYDIIYSKDQSLVDGFDERNEKFQDKIKLPARYDIFNPGNPFFLIITPNGQECPSEEYKPFKIQYVIPYEKQKEVTQNVNANTEKQQPEIVKLQKCEKCNLELELQSILYLQCSHFICLYCIQDRLEDRTDGNYFIKNVRGESLATCPKCRIQLKNEEIEKIVRIENFQRAQKMEQINSPI